MEAEASRQTDNRRVRGVKAERADLTPSKTLTAQEGD